MQISFFEEYPTKENLAKLKPISWKTKLYVAAYSLDEFNSTKKPKNVSEMVYWPILKKQEGYWISPFSRRSALLRIFNELHNKNVPVMIDAELPTTKNPFLYITQSINFFRNRKLIQNFIKSRKNISVAEYYPKGKEQEKILARWGLHYNPTLYHNKIIKMVYHSLHSFNENFIKNELATGKKDYSRKFIVAYGVLATGVAGNEKILSLEQLKTDMEIAESIGIKEVIIYRLGGINKKVVNMLKKFV